MARWLQHARNLAGFQRRWSLNAPLAEVSSGVVPVAVVDKHYGSDEQNLWGMFVQAASNLGQIEACALVAQDREVLIHKIEFWWDPAAAANRPVHIFTPLQAYNPFDAAVNAYFAWWQGKAVAQDIGQLGGTFGMGGLGTGLQAVIVNMAPVITIGPSFPSLTLGAFGAARQTVQPIWSFQDPPWRLKPFTMACVQSVNALVGAGQFLNVNFYYTERLPQGESG